MSYGLTELEMGQLRMSIGHGGKKLGRPMSPIEVASTLGAIKARGASSEAIGSTIGLSPSNVGRFLRLLRLPKAVQHQVDWGSGGEFIAFSSAIDLSRLDNTRDQVLLANDILAHSLTSKEVRQVVQLRKRSRRLLEDCIAEVKGMRTVVERRFVLIGTVSDEVKLLPMFLGLSSSQRGELMRRALESSGFTEATGRLGDEIFTLVGAEELLERVKQLGTETVERRVRAGIVKELRNVASC